MSTNLPVHFENVSQRWITLIQDGVVTLIQRIEENAFVVCANELPAICANAELVSNEQARAIADAIRCRLE